jgi:uncharacterized tellurite resistance protein B-like protein
MADVFVSYKRADSDRAAALANALKRETLTVWWDTHLSTGEDWLRTLVREIDDAKCLIGVWTSNCVDDDGFFRESDSSGHNFIRIEHERAGTKKVIGALLDRNAMPILYADRQCAVLSEWDLADTQFPEFRKLVDAIKARIGAAASGAKKVINLFETETTHAGATKLMSSLVSRRGGGWTIGEACMFLLVSASLTTRMSRDQEVDTVRSIVQKSRSLNLLASPELARIDATIWERAKQDPNALAGACQALPAEMRLPLFAQCVEIVLADGELDKSSAEFLNQIAILLQLDQRDAQRMFEMLVLKNRF